MSPDNVFRSKKRGGGSCPLAFVATFDRAYLINRSKEEEIEVGSPEFFGYFPNLLKSHPGMVVISL
jgi:hypothetical protein